MSRNDVRAYYAQFGEREWERLTNPDDGVIEFAVNCHALATHLPVGARVLDIGGGPGRYSIWLAQRGHSVVLADLSPELLAIAREQIGAAGVEAHVEEIVEADACDLSRWSDASFDAALCLGPFYHLPDAADRERAAAELARVLRPGGVAFVAFMPRCVFLRRTFAVPDERRHLVQADFVERLLQDGVFVNDVPGRFTQGYGARPEEIAPFFDQHNFAALALLASEGITFGLEGVLSALAMEAPDVYQAAMDVIIRTASEPSILGMAGHLLYVGKRAAHIVYDGS